MSLRLADRLSAARRRRFVGREDERALFRSLLSSQELPFVLLHVFGPGGIGKTTLLKEFHALAGEANVPTVFLDARNIDPSPEAFMAAMQFALGLGPSENPLDVLASSGQRYVV